MEGWITPIWIDGSGGCCAEYGGRRAIARVKRVLNWMPGFNQNVKVLTSVSVIVLILVVRRKKDVVLAGLRLLLGEVLILDFGKLDHCDGGEMKVRWGDQ